MWQLREQILQQLRILQHTGVFQLLAGQQIGLQRFNITTTGKIAGRSVDAIVFIAHMAQFGDDEFTQILATVTKKQQQHKLEPVTVQCHYQRLLCGDHVVDLFCGKLRLNTFCQRRFFSGRFSCVAEPCLQIAAGLQRQQGGWFQGRIQHGKSAVQKRT